MAMTKEQEAKLQELEAKLQELEQKNQVLEAEKERREALERSEGMQAEQLRAILNMQGEKAVQPYVETEKVPIKLIKDNYQYKEPLYLCINGRNMIIQRGKTVMVDKYVADFIANMKDEQDRVDELADQEEQDFLNMTSQMVK